MKVWGRWWVVLVVVAGAQAQVQQRGAADRTAFRAARAVTEPEARLAALDAFARQYPESALRDEAVRLELDTVLASFPERTELIHALATADVASAPAGLERWIEQARVADAMADAGASAGDGGPAGAGPAGADLADAQRWAQDAVSALTEEAFRRETAAARRRYGLERLGAGKLAEQFRGYRASFLAAMANVELREKLPGKAEPLVAEAYRLEPLSSEVNRLRGELALLGHRDAEALEDFERAAATGVLAEPWRAEMLRLYAASPGADRAEGLEKQVDAVYAKLYPPSYALPPRPLPAGGHTVLVELFSGAGCEPCVAPDLAVESLLGTYSRQDLVVLEYDENIPRPDPLTNPASVARGAAYGVGTTPEAFLDGAELPVVGASREDVENVVVEFADQIETRAAVASPLKLELTASRAGDVVTGTAAVRVLATGAPMGAPLPTVHMALVEDEVRYSGENGIRFHRMVVRAMGSASAGMGAKPVVTAGFDLRAIAAKNLAYLDTYEQSNDRYGVVHFRDKGLRMVPEHLAVAAWVEEPGSHKVMQAAFAPVAP